MQKTKASGELLVFWRGLIPAIAITPIIFLYDVAFPSHWLFYAATVTTSMLVVYTDRIKLTAPQKYGAGPYSRLIPITIWLAFIGWVIVDSEYRHSILNNPTELVFVISALSLGFWGTLRLKRNCSISTQAFIFIAPTILLSAVTAILNKTAMDSSGAFWSGVLIYAWIQSLIIPSVRILINYYKNGTTIKEYFAKDILAVGVWIGFLFLLLVIFKNSAMSLVENPAYVLLIGFTQPFIIVLTNVITGHNDSTDKLGGFAIICSVLLIIVGTRI